MHREKIADFKKVILKKDLMLKSQKNPRCTVLWLMLWHGVGDDIFLKLHANCA
jgi:hypothetical protein